MLCDPIDGSPPGSPVPGILQARTLEWVAISFSNSWKWKVKGKSLSRVRLLATPWTAAYQAPPSMDFPGKSTGVGCHCLLHSISLGLLFSIFFVRFFLAYFCDEIFLTSLSSTDNLIATLMNSQKTVLYSFQIFSFIASILHFSVSFHVRKCFLWLFLNTGNFV